MKIEINYTPSCIKKTLYPCTYEMADGTIRYYRQTGKGGLNDEKDKNE